VRFCGSPDPPYNQVIGGKSLSPALVAECLAQPFFRGPHDPSGLGSLRDIDTNAVAAAAAMLHTFDDGVFARRNNQEGYKEQKYHCQTYARETMVYPVNRNLDFLRAFAVLLVAGGHSLAFFGFVAPLGPVQTYYIGKLGVYIFFVHTSFVLMQSLERSPGAYAFFIRRAFRIYPLAILIIVAVASFHIPQATISTHHFNGWQWDSMDLFANIFLVQDFSFRVPILGQSWSLIYELGMYLFLPVLFLVARSVNRAVGVYFLALLASLALYHPILVLGYPVVANFWYFAPCFLSGVVAYQIAKTKQSKLPAFWWPIFVLVITLLYSAAETHPVYAFCGLLGLVIPRFEQITFRPLVQACHYIARYSYGIYLTHTACIYFAFERGARLPLGVRIAVFLALLVSVPVILYHGVEAPMIAFGKRVSQSVAAVSPLPTDPEFCESGICTPS
jgi:peptidoglycan/LPS O-acetylase OafA/YrhL